MNIIKSYRFIPLLVSLAGSSTFISCDDEPEVTDPLPIYAVVDFEQTNLRPAGPTSFGENLYPDYSGIQYVSAELPVTKDVTLHVGLNISDYNGKPDFSAGGVAISRWNIMKNTSADQATDWWYSYQNQCSIYNTASISGANQYAGADRSSTFAVIYGNKSEWGDFRPEISLSDNKELSIEQVSICPTAYLYGIVTKGNPFGSDPEKTLKEQNGWLKVLAYGFDANGKPTNNGSPVEKYICDYRSENSSVDIPTTWTEWSLSGLGKVNSIKFDFEGSDVTYGSLATPCYLCIDNIYIRISE
ncbi:MAG: DUF4465 domain-containing protein [Paramuribaculum sp.]|nr:DUF4465 domain-containing protein [Paramuribaculum sp.]